VYKLKYILNFLAYARYFFKYQIVFTVICILEIRYYRVFVQNQQIFSAGCTNNGYICTWLDLKRDNRYPPKLFYTMHASGRIFMRNLNISVVLGSHTQVINSPVYEIETVGRTSYLCRWQDSSFTPLSSSIFTLQFRRRAFPSFHPFFPS